MAVGNAQGSREKAFWVIGSVLIVVYALTPVAWILSLSLKPSGSLTDGRFIPRTVTFEHYSSIFSEGFFTSALRNSLGIALVATLLAVLLATWPPTPSLGSTSPASA